MRSLETPDTLRTRSTLLAQRALDIKPLRPSCLRHHCFFNELLQTQTLNHMRKLRNNTFVGNTGHTDNEIDFAVSDGLEGKKVELQAYSDVYLLPESSRRKRRDCTLLSSFEMRVDGLCQGREKLFLDFNRNHGLPWLTVRPSLLTLCSVTNQVLAQLIHWKETTAHKNDLNLLPKEIDG